MRTNFRLFYLLYFFSFAVSIKVGAQSKDSSCHISIFSKDLSEDGTLMSSQNDELLLLIYEWKDTNAILNAPVLFDSFVLDTAERNRTFHVSLDKQKKYLLFLLELDDDNRTVEQLDPVIRIYRNTIVNLYDRKKYSDLEKYLGDEDLLGYILFDVKNEKSKQVEFKGRQSMDSYHYFLKLN